MQRLILNYKAGSFKKNKCGCFWIFLIAILILIISPPVVANPDDDPLPPIPKKYSNIRNPLQKNEKNISEGEWLYDTRCSPCHGGNLDGNGPEAEGLFPKPANFIYLLTIIQPKESYLFYRIKEGGPGLPREWMPWNSAMPAWKEELTDEEIWKIILYIYEATGVSPQ